MRMKSTLALPIAVLALAACASHVTPPPDSPPAPLDQRLEGYWKIDHALTPEQEEAGAADALSFETVSGSGGVVHTFGYCGKKAISMASFNVENGVITTDAIRALNDAPAPHLPTADALHYSATVTKIEGDALELDGHYMYHRVHSEKRLSVEKYEDRLCAYAEEPKPEPPAPPAAPPKHRRHRATQPK